MAETPGRRRIGVCGARGHVGAELLALVARHPELELAFLGSRALAGQPLGAIGPAVGESAPALADLRFEDLGPDAVAERPVDAVLLALPNGLSAPFVAAIRGRAAHRVIVDLSADHRFDSTWTYGLPERNRARNAAARSIANPGCYATAAQIALDPLLDELDAPPVIFGVSGYSGAGTTPSPRNDPEVLRDNLLPYSLTGHVHEREIGHQLGRAVRFLPHVAAFFRGLGLTIDCTLREPSSPTALLERYRARYAGEPLVRVQAEPPEIRHARGAHHVSVGGFACDGRRVVVVATIDNLLKGAATQASQNLNLALGIGELRGIC